jgi:pimeloyl-ACP methyl ester carboxylesterase
MLDDHPRSAGSASPSDQDLPPVMLVHGLASSFAHGWEQNAWTDLLADAGRRVLPVDLPGHGSAADAAPAAFADVGGRLAEAIAPHAPLDAVGFSAGARLLLELAADEPARFRKLVLIGLGDGVFRAEDREPFARVLESGDHATDDVRAQLFFRLARSAGNDPARVAAFLRRPERAFDEESLARVSCPVLVVIGENDFSGPAERLAGALPSAELVVLRRVDHFAAPRDFSCIEATLAFIDAA